MSRRPRALSVLFLSLVLVGPLAAFAQEPEQPTATLALVRQPPWHAPGDALRLKLSITNTGTQPLEGFTLTLASHPRVSTRSELELMFEGVTRFEESLITLTASRRPIEAGDTRLITVAEPVESLTSLAGASAGGVYPLTVRLLDASRSLLLGEVITPLIYYPQLPETRLNVVPVLALNDVAYRAPDGVFDRSAAEAVGPGGWLRGLIDAVALLRDKEPVIRPARPGRRGRPPRPARYGFVRGLHLGIAPTPRLLEELSDMADGYRTLGDDGLVRVERNEGPARDAAQVLAAIRGLLDQERVQLLLTPYSSPDLPSLSLDQLVDQLAEARLVLRQTLGLNAERDEWLFPPEGRLDQASLGDLQAAATGTARHTLFAAQALEELPDPAAAGCPELSPTFTCPVKVETFEGATTGFVTDRPLDRRMAAVAQDPSTALETQRLLAETAMIHEELPGHDDRVVHIAFPSLWHPRPAYARRLLREMTRAPWLRTRAPREALEAVAAPARRAVIREAPAVQGAPGDDHFEAIERAKDAVAGLSSMVGAPERQSPEAVLVEQLNRDILVAESRNWWGDETTLGRGLAYATASEDKVEEHLGRVSVGGAEVVTLTSRRGLIQLLIFNDGPFPVTVDVHLDGGPKLDVAPLQAQRIAPESIRRLEVEARAQASGTFPLTVRVETPDGSLVAERNVLIRSTEFNRVALAITAGAFGFLVFFSLYRTFRRKRSVVEPDASSA